MSKTTNVVQFKNLAKDLALARIKGGDMAFGVYSKENQVFLTPIDYTGYQQSGTLIALKNDNGWGLYDLLLKQWLITCQYMSLTISDNQSSATGETEDGKQAFHTF